MEDRAREIGEKIAKVERDYLADDTPWGGSGFWYGGGRAAGEKLWEMVRRPLLEGIDRSGSLLDVGCANGYLLECLRRWGREKGIELEPHGVERSPKLAALARERLGEFGGSVACADAHDWTPSAPHDFVRTGLYAPPEEADEFIARVLRDMVKPGGRLIVAEYRSNRATPSVPWIDEILDGLGREIVGTASGFGYEGIEMMRAVWIDKPTS